MIYRPDHESGLLAITQPAHAWMAGALAAAWGNMQFARPVPFDAVVLATRLHDIGWLPWDAAPRLGADGRPVGFLQTTLEETIPTWERGVRQVSMLDPYSALLISLHATTVYRRRLERGIDPPAQQAQIAALLAAQEHWRAGQLAALADHPAYGGLRSEAQVHAAYRWLRVCDLLSLVMLTDVFADEGEIADVPGREVGAFVTLRYARPAPLLVELEPWPFAEPLVTQALQARRLTTAVYPDQRRFEEALAQAPWQQLNVTVRAG